jgi:regulatory protein
LSQQSHIVNIERGPRAKRLTVTLTDATALSLTADVAARFGLMTGMALSAERRAEVAAAQAHEDAMAASLRLVAFRPRSEKELRQSLARRGVQPETRDAVATRLRELGLLDDKAFAISFVESRDRSSPRSRRLIAQELRQKGLARDVAAGAAEAVDDTDAAYRAAARRARSLIALPYTDFERRLGTFLLRRGFSHETAFSTVRVLWQEQSSGPARAEHASS